MNNNKQILGLVGQIACGKGTLAKYLAEKHGARILGFSDSLREMLNKIYLPVERNNMQKLSTALRELFGQDLLSRIVFEEIKNSDEQLIVLDGIRRWADIELIKNLPNFKLVRVVVDQKIRYDRLIKRSQNLDDQQKTFEQFLLDGQNETEREIASVMAGANLEIDNSGDDQVLFEQVEKLLQIYK